MALDRITRGSRKGRIATRACFVLVMLALLAPFYVMVTTALGTKESFVQLPVTWWPRHISWSNVTSVFQQIPLAHYFVNSLIIAGGSTLVDALAAIPAAYAVARLRFRGRTAFLIFIIATQMISPIVLLIASLKLMLALHLYNSYWALILMDATISLPITTWIITAYLSGLPDEIQDAATLDGIGRVRMLIDHFLPLGLPGIATALVFSFVIAWNEFIFALTFVTSPGLRPLTTGIYAFVGEAQIQWNYLMMASLLSVIPVFLIFLVVQRRLVAGLTAGAVK